MQSSMFIGLDVHKATISVAVAHRPDHVRKLVEKLGADGRHLHLSNELKN